MLEVSDLVVDIAGSRILHGVSLSVAPGELVCLLGRNGAGKTTLLRTIMGYRPAAGGQVRFGGTDLARLPTHAIARAGLGFSPEESETFADLSVAENLRLPTLTRRGDGRARIEAALKVFPRLRGYLARGGGQLSGGERKMLSVARALVLDPKLLLLDEPFEGLSPLVIPDIAAGIAAIREQGRAILIAESNVHHVPEGVDRVAVIERGAIVFNGTLAEALAEPTVANVIATAA